MKKRGIVFAFILSGVFTALLGLLSNLVTTYLAPSLENYSMQIIIALVVVFVISVVVSTYVFIRTLPEDSTSILPNAMPGTQLEHVPAQVSQLPERPYRELVGRDALVGEIMGALRDPKGKWMIGLDGIGGIGKTALALEIAELCQRDGLFDTVVWEQAPKEQGRWNAMSGGTLTFETVLDSIARRLGAGDILQLKYQEKLERVRSLVKTKRVLIVLDNLETAKENQNEIARKLMPLLNPGKAILTSRHRFDNEVFASHMGGLESDSALRFIRGEAQEKNIDRISSATDTDLRQVARITGGSPLAMKLVIGQLIRLPLDVVLNNLKDVTLSSENQESEYVRFYKSIFMPSWKLLSDEAQHLLIAMANFAPNVGGTYEAIQATSELSDDILSQNIDELWRFSFLDVGKAGSLKKVRYYLHALTQYFVLSDIVRVLK